MKYEVFSINLENLKQIVIGDNETDKIVCYFLCNIDPDFDGLLIIANKICKFLNDENTEKEYNENSPPISFIPNKE
jgi:hypothetical protein